MLKNLGLCVPKKNAEETIFLIKELKLLDRDLKINGIESGFVIIPIVRRLSRDEFNILKTNIRCIELVTHNFLEMRRGQTVRDVLKDSLPPQILNKIPKSVDVIGDMGFVFLLPFIFVCLIKYLAKGE